MTTDTAIEHRLDAVRGYYRTSMPDGFAAFDKAGRTKRCVTPDEIKAANAWLAIKDGGTDT